MHEEGMLKGTVHCPGHQQSSGLGGTRYHVKRGLIRELDTGVG